MLISIIHRTTIDHTQYPKRLLVLVRTNGHQNCGVFSGQDGFGNTLEMNRRQPTVPQSEEPLGVSDWELFEIHRPRGSRPNTVRPFRYVVTLWNAGVYLQYPESYPLTLEDSYAKPWVLHFKDISVVFPDYMADVPPIQDDW